MKKNTPIFGVFCPHMVDTFRRSQAGAWECPSRGFASCSSNSDRAYGPSFDPSLAWRQSLQEWRSQAGNMLGYSLGVPIRTLIGLASQAGIESEWLKVETVPPRELTEEELMNIASTIMVEVPSRKNYIDWVNAGNQLWRLGGSKEAIEAFDQAIKIKPKSYPAWYGRGLALQGEKKYREAIAAFEKVTEISSKISEAWRERGVAFAELKDYPQALASINEAIKHSRQPDFKLYALRGDWLSAVNRYSEAADAYSEAIKIKPNLFAYNNRGNAWANLKEYEKAIADYTQAINLDPEDAAAYFGRGFAYYQQEDKERGITDMKKAEQLFCEQGSPECEQARDILKQLDK